MEETLHLPDAPAIPGLAFRPLRGEEDAAALAAVHAGRQERDGVDPLSTLEWVPGPEDIRPGLAEVAAAGQQERYCIAQVGAKVAGYGRVTSWHEADGTWVYLCLGWVLPEWRGRGIGTALLHWAEALSRRLAAAEHPGEKAELAANASSTEHEATALVRGEGYAVGYTALAFILDPAAEVPDLPLPAGFSTRLALPADCPAIAACVDEAYRYDNPGGRFGEDFDPAGYAVELTGPRHDPALWQVAWAGDEVAGQVIPMVSRGRAEVFEVSVRPAYRRRGLARALLCRALRGLRARGVNDIRLHTQDDFPTRAQDLYRSVGFRLDKTFPRYRKDLAHREPAPGPWPEAEPRSKEELLAQIRGARESLAAAVALVPPARLEEPLPGGWSVKDILAHIAEWEGRLVGWLQAAARGEAPQMVPPGMTAQDLDRWNEQIYQEHRGRPLDEVLEYFRRSYREALAAVEAFPEAGLLDPGRFPWREGRALGIVVADNMNGHYAEHDRQIRAWLQGA